mmetsp:Transcript_26704/g.66955  ORF Transcript_26704/g.66955 Transcript_26704/m.66955 type:complete len:202 (-) Transcript_26704:84-689(-)
MSARRRLRSSSRSLSILRPLRQSERKMRYSCLGSCGPYWLTMALPTYSRNAVTPLPPSVSHWMSSMMRLTATMAALMPSREPEMLDTPSRRTGCLSSATECAATSCARTERGTAPDSPSSVCLTASLAYASTMLTSGSATMASSVSRTATRYTGRARSSTTLRVFSASMLRTSRARASESASGEPGASFPPERMAVATASA